MFEEFFLDLDTHWAWSSGKKIELKVIGSAALMLQTGYERGTKDGDVLETRELVAEVRARLSTLAGKGSEIHARRRMYLDIVPNGLPFLPQVPQFHSVIGLNTQLRFFDVAVLDVVDVVVSKLKRFSPSDMDDIANMIEMGLVPHARLVSRFTEAVDFFSMDARAEELHRYVRNLHRVERDELGVPESDIDLPDFIR